MLVTAGGQGGGLPGNPGPTAGHHGVGWGRSREQMDVHSTSLENVCAEGTTTQHPPHPFLMVKANCT